MASELGLAGWVNNTVQGVTLELEGPRSQLELFLARLESDKPPRSIIQGLEAFWLDPAGYTGFEIRESEAGGSKTALALPDIATCPDCLRELFDPSNRRHLYPFTNCTHCGPRFSIIEALPYDRANTSMKQFVLCPRCQAEYDDPRDRRFHAQPNACPDCGPQIEFWRGNRDDESADGAAAGASVYKRGHEALLAAAEALRQGLVVAVKGLGGFHLMAAAHNDGAIQRLRERKHREEKPFALMFPSLAAIAAVCEVSTLEERLLGSPEAPIVLLRRRGESPIAEGRTPSAERGGPVAEARTPAAEGLAPTAEGRVSIAEGVAPGNPNLGCMLPCTPLHHLLMSLLGFPVVATSGNLGDEPICIDERDAFERLGGIADVFLVHDRPIVRHVDDSIVRVTMGREQVLRRARGYAPLPITLDAQLSGPDSRPVLAVGAHLKNTVALAVGRQVFLSQHIGDLETDRAFEAFRRVVEDFETFYETRPEIIAADAHPEYLSTQFARDRVAKAGSGRFVPVQHHIAHVLSCMAENELQPPVLGVSWDGTGYGLDGTVWGGEFFFVTDTSCERVAHFRQFRLPGGDRAVKEPRRIALGLLYELFGDSAFEMKHLASVGGLASQEVAAFKNMLARGVNSPLTSSAGRLFDVVAALIGLRQFTRFEGQAAMELEFALEETAADDAYPPTLAAAGEGGEPAPKGSAGSPMILDWAPMIHGVLADLEAGAAPGRISAKFHNSLVEIIVAAARCVGTSRVALSGGCFQNRYLTERSVHRLREAGFQPYWHQRVPPNDGGIALGQIIAARREER